jgi:hypothetical protein
VAAGQVVYWAEGGVDRLIRQLAEAEAVASQADDHLSEAKAKALEADQSNRAEGDGDGYLAQVVRTASLQQQRRLESAKAAQRDAVAAVEAAREDLRAEERAARAGLEFHIGRELTVIQAYVRAFNERRRFDGEPFIEPLPNDLAHEMVESVRRAGLELFADGAPRRSASTVHPNPTNRAEGTSNA